MNRKRSRGSGAALLLGALLFPGCGEITSGGVGEVEVWTRADDPDPAPQATASSFPARAAAREPGRPTAASSAAEGWLIVVLRTYLQADATGEWIEITDGPRDLTLDLRGETERRAGVRLLSSGRYTRLRVVFERVEADVQGGLVVDGVPLTGVVSVDLGAGGTLTVERELAVDVVRDGSLDVAINLNARVWLATASPVTRTVAAAALQGAVAVQVR